METQPSKYTTNLSTPVLGKTVETKYETTSQQEPDLNISAINLYIELKYKSLESQKEEEKEFLKRLMVFAKQNPNLTVNVIRESKVYQDHELIKV